MKNNKIIVTVFVFVAFVVFGFFLFGSNNKTVLQAPGNNPVTSTTDGAPGAYTNTVFGFTIQPAAGFTVSEAYLNQNLGPGREIPGIAFIIPASLSTGTNLSSDSYLAVERLLDVDCTPATFIDAEGDIETVTINSSSFQKASASDAAAGNRYDQTVYVTEKGDVCYAIREFVHTTQIANYPAGTVMEYDKTKLSAAFDAMLSSFKVD